MKGRILVVDDQPAFRRLVRRVLVDAGYDVTEAADGQKALELVRAGSFHLVVSDVSMPGLDGMTLLERIRAEVPETRVVLITAHATVQAAVEAMRHGALDYLTKPLADPDELLVLVARAMAQRLAAEESLQSEGELVFEHSKMGRVAETIRRVAPTEATVLITGASGTGKELVAQEIHRHSPRARRPFVAVNCAALAESLLDSELFGHERGAFTGADRQRAGRFEAAHGGTLFLDEIGETSPGLQAKLLRVLQERSFERVGGTKTIEVDVRILAATNRDLGSEVRSGRFRQDLLYRLAVVPIELPALRHRGRDVILLANHFLASLCKRHRRPGLSLELSAEAALLAHDWPGNVRELYNVVERAVILTRGERIGEGDLLLGVGAVQERKMSAPINLKDLEREAIRRALEKTGGNRREAARMLGIGLRTLHYKLSEYGLR